MELLLRKVKYGIKFPEFLKNTFCLYHTFNTKTSGVTIYEKAFLYYDVDKHWYNCSSEKQVPEPDFWYEEISYKQLVEEQARIKFIPNQEKAKERYEKAVAYKDSKMNLPIIYHAYLEEALKIAAGIKENIQ